MGVFDFSKDAGQATPAGTNLSTYLMDMMPKVLDKFGLKVDNPSINIDDAGVVTVGGEAANQSTKEKIVLAVGNLKGVARVNDNMTIAGEAEAKEAEAAAAAAAAEPRFYTVKRGDSLSKIAKEFYGDPMKYPTIFEANQPLLTDPNKIYPGQALRIPEL